MAGNNEDFSILIDEQGHIRYVYSDALDRVFKGFPRTTTRASHVEPHPTKPGWLADMGPSGGPVLGADGSSVVWTEQYNERAGLLTPGFKTRKPEDIEPFDTRQEALDAEREWLREHQGL